MRATFSGLEIAKSGLQTAETGLDVTGQNVSKMNTEGYSLQTVEQSAVYYSSSSFKYAQVNSNKVGLGVTITSINQVRDKFLDTRYRAANSEASEQANTYSILSSIEGVIDETTTDGLGATLEGFYESLQSLTANAGDIEYEGLTRSAALKVTETLNYYNEQFETIKEQEKYDLSVTVNDINTLLTKINTMNKAIKEETLNGNTTNELLDSRNRYLDQLSSEIEITTISNADGTVSVKAGEQYLVDAENATIATISVQENADSISIVTANGAVEITSGSVKGYLDALNGNGSYAIAGANDFKGIKYYQSILNDFAASFSSTFNVLNGTGKPLFVGSTAGTIGISEGWLQDAGYITESTVTGAEDGANENILRMISALDSDTEISDYFTGSFDSFITSMMSDIAIDTDYYSDMSDTASAVLTSIDNQRESVKGVSLNEETVNLMKYQKAFEASARVITALDEMLSIIINNMGTVGR